jgi:hypothetical protein
MTAIIVIVLVLLVEIAFLGRPKSGISSRIGKEYEATGD